MNDAVDDIRGTTLGAHALICDALAGGPLMDFPVVVGPRTPPRTENPFSLFRNCLLRNWSNACYVTFRYEAQ